MIISYKKHRLLFKKPAGTSRSILLHNDVYYIFIENEGVIGVGECNALVGLSIDDLADYESILNNYVNSFTKKQFIDLSILDKFPSIKFGFETALLDLNEGGKKTLFPSDFTKGLKSIPINGLLWMGSKEYMLEQLQEKIDNGFSCIKMKIGAIDFNEELEVLKTIRQNFDASQIELRVDANGAFKVDDALIKLEKISKFTIHSIEQPIAVKQWSIMKELVKESPIPIALDEELIGISNKEEREEMLEMINPDYIILKPSLVGGMQDCDEWIEIANKNNIDWWITSALESNIGLNAIAQYAFNKDVTIPQGLGTGGLYTNNIDSPLSISNGELRYKTTKSWGEF